MKIALAVPTLNAGRIWSTWISALKATGVAVEDVFVIDSGSTDNTVSQSLKAGFGVKNIELNTFNHGGTRQLVVNCLRGYDIVVFLTQDAIISGPDSIQKLLLPFDDYKVAAVCGRQLPRKDASPVETHARLYNYPAQSRIRTLKDKDKLGLKVAFLSNSYAAYRISVLNEVGGFPEIVIFGEDMFVATKILLAGYKIAYQADACVYHSHNYSFVQEFQRYFDMGVFHERESWVRNELGGVEGEGVKFVISEIKFLQKNAFWRIPEAILRTLFRYAGFRSGLIENRLPLSLKLILTMNKVYFKR